MPIQNEPFYSRNGIDPARPWLNVRYINPHSGKSFRTRGLIDTGADDCAIPARYAPVLGHTLTDGIQSKNGTGNGITVAYKHTMRIEIPGFTTEEVLISFLPNLSVPLLGVRSFLSHFILTADYPKQHFSLRKP